MKPRFEVADILSSYGGDFLSSNPLSYQKRKVFRAIINCRTAALGGHIQSCSACDYQQIAYNSCRNRHCPKCQIQQREKWIKARLEQILPARHFHVVFTMPSELNQLCLQYPKQLYNTLFYAAWQTIKTFAKDQRYLGAKSGMVSILHTWGQNLSLHPHLHCIVPSGGITVNNKWKSAKGKGKYLFPVKAMSRVYRAIFLKRLKQLQLKGALQCEKLQKLVDNLFKKAWVVYAKKPFNGVKSVIEYLGRYSHKVAISNHRIKSIANNKISFNYKNYRNNQSAIMNLSGHEFIRRFSQHILPHRFVRIRHFGIFASRNKAILSQIRLNLKEHQKQKTNLELDHYCNPKDLILICPKCKKPTLENLVSMLPIRDGPNRKKIRL